MGKNERRPMSITGEPGRPGTGWDVDAAARGTGAADQPSRPILALGEIAKLEEGRLARGYAEVTPEHLLIGAPSVDLGAAVAGRAEPGSWLNSVVNLGMNVPVTDADIARIIDWYAPRGIEPTIELCPHADPSVTQACSAAGFVISPGPEIPGIPRGFDTIFSRGLDTGERVAIAALPEGVSVGIVDPSDEPRVQEFIDVAVARSRPGAPPPTEDERLTVRRCVRHPRTHAMAAFAAGRIVGVGLVEITTGACLGTGAGAGQDVAAEHARTAGPRIAALFSAKVLPAFRRRGIQQGLIAARLKLAMDRGASVATIGSRPGLGTERNVRRMGFQVAYTKVILVRPGPGLRRIGE